MLVSSYLNKFIGSLQDILKFFWKHDVNMTHIESRPTKGHHNNYNFFIDFEGKSGEPNVDALLKDLKLNGVGVMMLHDKKGMYYYIPCTHTHRTYY